MKCPFCASTDNSVVDSRDTEDARAIRRRRQCAGCARRFTTYERIEEQPLLVVKKDGSRVTFDRQRLKAGLVRACEKRPISSDVIDGIVGDIEKRAIETGERELPSVWFGEAAMLALKAVDDIAYVRFASVYRSFKDADDFARELAALRKKDADGPTS
ncbi:MAG TPA: transcriptional regulator NrdR [Myxococcota bacterium]